MPNIDSYFVISGIESGGRKQKIFRDDRLPGFGLRVTAAGSKSYIVEGRVNGTVKRISIGKVETISAEAARQQAKLILQQMAAGQDPTAKAPSLNHVLEDYVANRRLRPHTVKNYRHSTGKYFADWLPLPVDQITEQMVIKRHTDLGKQYAATTVNVAFCQLRTLLYHAVENFGLELENPVTVLGRKRLWFRQSRRQGVIPDHKLADWWQAVCDLATPKIRDFLLLVSLTGLRRGEASSLKWTQIDFDKRVLTIPGSVAKNHRDHLLPLTDFLVRFLNQRKQESKSEYVFSSRRDANSHLCRLANYLSACLANCLSA